MSAETVVTATEPEVARLGGPHTVLGHRIADTLRTAILEDELLPGSRIRQEELAERFGASRIPVREALRLLEADGLVTMVANSGAWVTALTLDECAEAYATRERVEPLLLRRSFEHLNDAQLVRLRSLVEEIAQTRDVGTFIRLDREFHLLSYEGVAQSSYLRAVVHRLWNVTQHYRRAYAALMREPAFAASHMEHLLLMDCIERADPDDAERVLTLHLRRTWLELRKHPELFAVRSRR